MRIKRLYSCNEPSFNPADFIRFENMNDLENIKEILATEYGVKSDDISIEIKDGYYEIKLYINEKIINIVQNNENLKINKEIAERNIMIKGWKVLLKNNPTHDFYDKFIKKNEGKRNFKVQHFHSTLDIHRGHLLADWFREYLVPIDKLEDNELNHFFGKGNVDNIYYQTKEANCKTNITSGQWTFEKKVTKFLEKNTEGEVIYKIENIFVQGKSIGRIILIYTRIDVYSDYLLLDHVFVPNVLNDDYE